MTGKVAVDQAAVASRREAEYPQLLGRPQNDEKVIFK
jgi:hypothetical protein